MSNFIKLTEETSTGDRPILVNINKICTIYPYIPVLGKNKTIIRFGTNGKKGIAVVESLDEIMNMIKLTNTTIGE